MSYKNYLFERKVVSLRLPEGLKTKIQNFHLSRSGLVRYTLHTDYTFSFALRDLILEGVLSLEKEHALDPASTSYQIRTFSKKRNNKDLLLSCHVSCSMSSFLINRVSGIAAKLGFNRAEAFRVVIERGLSSIL